MSLPLEDSFIAPSVLFLCVSLDLDLHYRHPGNIFLFSIHSKASNVGAMSYFQPTHSLFFFFASNLAQSKFPLILTWDWQVKNWDKNKVKFQVKITISSFIFNWRVEGVRITQYVILSNFLVVICFLLVIVQDTSFLISKRGIIIIIQGNCKIWKR